MTLFAFLVWFGGAWKLTSEPNATFLRTLFWPCLLGQYLVSNCVTFPPRTKEAAN